MANRHAASLSSTLSPTDMTSATDDLPSVHDAPPDAANPGLHLPFPSVLTPFLPSINRPLQAGVDMLHSQLLENQRTIQERLQQVCLSFNQALQGGSLGPFDLAAAGASASAHSTAANYGVGGGLSCGSPHFASLASAGLAAAASQRPAPTDPHPSLTAAPSAPPSTALPASRSDLERAKHKTKDDEAALSSEAVRQKLQEFVVNKMRNQQQHQAANQSAALGGESQLALAGGGAGRAGGEERSSWSLRREHHSFDLPGWAGGAGDSVGASGSRDSGLGLASGGATLATDLSGSSVGVAGYGAPTGAPLAHLFSPANFSALHAALTANSAAAVGLQQLIELGCYPLVGAAGLADDFPLRKTASAPNLQKSELGSASLKARSHIKKKACRQRSSPLCARRMNGTKAMRKIGVDASSLGSTPDSGPSSPRGRHMTPLHVDIANSATIKPLSGSLLVDSSGLQPEKSAAFEAALMPNISLGRPPGVTAITAQPLSETSESEAMESGGVGETMEAEESERGEGAFLERLAALSAEARLLVAALQDPAAAAASPASQQWAREHLRVCELLGAPPAAAPALLTRFGPLRERPLDAAAPSAEWGSLFAQTLQDHGLNELWLTQLVQQCQQPSQTSASRPKQPLNRTTSAPLPAQLLPTSQQPHTTSATEGPRPTQHDLVRQVLRQNIMQKTPQAAASTSGGSTATSVAATVASGAATGAPTISPPPAEGASEGAAGLAPSTPSGLSPLTFALSHLLQNALPKPPAANARLMREQFQKSRRMHSQPESSLVQNQRELYRLQQEVAELLRASRGDAPQHPPVDNRGSQPGSGTIVDLHSQRRKMLGRTHSSPIVGSNYLPSQLPQTTLAMQATPAVDASQRSSQKKTGIGTDELMLKHDCQCGNLLLHPESSLRLLAIFALLRQQGIWQAENYRQVKGRKATMEELLSCHTESYANIYSTSAIMKSQFGQPPVLLEICSRFRSLPCGGVGTDWDTVWNDISTPVAARIATGCVIDLAAMVMRDQLANGFALVRPPGHHAEPNSAMGFCYFNSIAICAKQLLRVFSLSRILIVDWDVHHGNSTQQLFYNDPSVLYVSIHRHDNGQFFPGTGSPEEVGVDAGVGYNVNIAWHGNCQPPMGDAEYLGAFRTIVLPIAREFRPEIILVSAGFDAAIGHQPSLGGYMVTPACFAMMTRLLQQVAESGRVVLVLEGGYQPDVLAKCVLACLQALVNDPAAPAVSADELNRRPAQPALEALAQTLRIQSDFWNCLKRYGSQLQMSWAEAEVRQRQGVDDQQSCLNQMASLSVHPRLGASRQLASQSSCESEPMEHS